MTKFLKKIIDKFVYNYYFICYFFEEKMLKDQKAFNKFAKKLLTYNNKRVLKNIKDTIPKKISILLPHCIQDYNCCFKITSNIENCKRCGKCKIADLLNLKSRYNIDIKVATGGTLARLYLKKERPNFIIAVACKRDLVTGIFDMYPMNVYGIFNIIKTSPCINTDVDISEIEKILDFVINREE
ncbi:MAG: DUF116 domain-containing protein [Fusobacterium perfoetens]|uniref:DUF116 domain-containing protein n=1 Tax=Fusobacterium perfoetens TaxID=852 RepID=UPI0023EFC293|nr:DUF116 domain-containing protein [Fusobacterium perfoetens]MCI6152394.1 DUF116 domain-containing protein [Fusobacterium perfoetens]MDY3236993.1 DUF116 domain-containing protein [Fusobacterium perfoetens]